MSKKARTINELTLHRTSDEKKEACDQIEYEKAMLDFTIKGLRKNPRGLGYAVLMESFLIHARIINDFFYGYEMRLNGEKKLMKDDMIAEDIVEDQEQWQKVKPHSNKLSSELVQKINNQLTHLTYRRVKGKYGDWEYEDIYKRMSELVDSFYQNINP
jgi:hypothetical protein